MSGKTVVLKDGAGGRAMRALVQQTFIEGFDPAPDQGIGLLAMDDGATLRVGDQWLVVTADSHVVHPIFFPGGDIGRIAIAGTVNDLAVMGAPRPLGITCAVIIEEGFSRELLERIWASLRATCREAGTTVVTGDTKVMGKGEVDGIVISTAGFGLARRPVPDAGLRIGDRIIVSGTVGDHGLAIMSRRHELALEGDLASDVAPINGLVAAALEEAGEGVTAMKDPTRGGLASALHEMASKSGVGMVIEEAAVPITDAVRAAGELLGIDPLMVANEGKVVMGVRPDLAERVLKVMRAHPLGRQAAIVGECVEERRGSVILDTGFGRRLLPEPEGEPMPRIC